MLEAGTRFEAYVTEARTELGLSLAELARRSGIAASAWHAWFRGDHTPRRNSLILAGPTLNRTPDQLEAAWFGGRLRAPTATAERSLRQLVEDHEARLRAVESELRSLREQLGAGGSPTRSSPHGIEG